MDFVKEIEPLVNLITGPKRLHGALWFSKHKLFYIGAAEGGRTDILFTLAHKLNHLDSDILFKKTLKSIRCFTY